MKGCVAVVTGGSRSIGRDISIKLAAEGVSVVVNYSGNREAAEETAEEMRRLGGEASIYKANVAVSADVNRMLEETVYRYGRLDYVVNNAGIWPTHSIHEMSDDDWERTLAVNLNGAFYSCRWAIRHWIEQRKPGSIVNIVSQAAFRGSTTGHAHYAAAKAGVVGLTKSIARETAKYGIRANCVSPGMIRTDMNKETLSDPSSLSTYLQRIPMGKIGDAADISSAVLYLLSDRSGYVTGTTIDVSGGMLML